MPWLIAGAFFVVMIPKSGKIAVNIAGQKKKDFCLKRWKPCYDWSRWADLNRRPTDYESVALPAELHRHSSRDEVFI